MNIKKLYKHKNIFEDKLDNIKTNVEIRWKKLIGPGCGYMEDWGFNEKDMLVVVSFEHRGNNGTDVIPIKFFEMENAEEAKKEFDLYTKKKREDTAAKEESEKKEKRRALYKELKNEFGKKIGVLNDQKR